MTAVHTDDRASVRVPDPARVAAGSARAAIERRRRRAIATFVVLAAVASAPPGLRAETPLATRDFLAGESFEFVVDYFAKAAKNLPETDLLELMRQTVTARIDTINGPWGLTIQTFPIDYWNSYKGGRLKDRALRLNQNEVYGRDLAALAWDLRAGACEEHAAVMQVFLGAAGFKGVRIVRGTKPHAFPVVGMPPDADPDNPWTWGVEPIVPDSWLGTTVRGAEAIWANAYMFGGGANSVGGGKEKLTTREEMRYFCERGAGFMKANCARYLDVLARFLRYPRAVREAFATKPVLDACIDPGNSLVLARTEYETYDPQLDEFIPGSEGSGPNSSWKTSANEFTQTHNSGLKVAASWSGIPPFLEAGKNYPFTLDASMEGTSWVQIALFPVMDVGNWSNSLREPCDGVDAPLPNGFRLLLSHAQPDKPERPAGRILANLAVRTGKKSIDLDTGTVQGGAASIGNVRELHLQLECMRRTRIHWIYQRIR